MRDIIKITGAQRRALFAAARERGLSIDDLRNMTPAGSISMLTCAEASRILGRLKGNCGGDRQDHRHHRRPRRPSNVYQFATDAQRGKINALRIDLGFSPKGLKAFLALRHFADGRPMTKIDSSTDANAVIELLKHVLARKRELAQRRQRSAADAITA